MFNLYFTLELNPNFTKDCFGGDLGRWAPPSDIECCRFSGTQLQQQNMMSHDDWAKNMYRGQNPCHIRLAPKGLVVCSLNCNLA